MMHDFQWNICVACLNETFKAGEEFNYYLMYFLIVSSLDM